MSTGMRRRPIHLAAKLLQVREGLGLSQTTVIERLNLGEHLTRGKISEYERAEREPDLLTLLAYARGAGVHVDDLIDDSIELPEKLPAAKSPKGGKPQKTKSK
jgi:transcriptional regulator with XRE-family HTH domain